MKRKNTLVEGTKLIEIKAVSHERLKTEASRRRLKLKDAADRVVAYGLKNIAAALS